MVSLSEQNTLRDFENILLFLFLVVPTLFINILYICGLYEHFI